jgi:DnaK suppressor protein
MPARKVARKKRKRTGASKARTSSRRQVVRKKAKGKKRKVSKTRKKSSTGKVSKKKAAARRKPAARKSGSKKVAKKAGGKKAKKSTASKRPAKSKSTKNRKSTKVTAKKASRKKKPAPAKPSARTPKKISKKKPSSRKAAPKKQASRPGHKSSAAARQRSRQDVLSGPIHGIEPYAMKRGEEYMSTEQLEHFRAILTSWKRELMNEVDRTVHHMQDEAANFPDPNDRATQESEFGLELRTRDRERKLLRKIDSALARIDEGTYGYCDETGEEIGLKRLEARPVATLSLEAQERREMAERQFRDRDDRYR